ncbi:hypothetical protein CIK05_11030 [Bdellovibrio sp. qaytius]|nr:hypothetical protein CIK05_11030 [Bdellovibrio sp. qaytius]
MKYIYFTAIALSFFSCASTNISKNANGRAILTGEITDDQSTHDTRHQHELKFTDQATGQVFNIVDSPELVKLHESGKNYLIQADVAQTSKFLFWGGNLVVKNFNVIKETSEEIPHQQINETPRKPSNMRRVGKERN